MKVTLMNAMKDTVTRHSIPAIIPALAMAPGRARTPTPTRRLKRKTAATCKKNYVSHFLLSDIFD